MSFDQVFLMILGGTAIFLTNDKNPNIRKYACIFGLASQPFWFYSSYKAGQWGIFIVSFWYAFSWARGFYYGWLRP